MRNKRDGTGQYRKFQERAGMAWSTQREKGEHTFPRRTTVCWPLAHARRFRLLLTLALLSCLAIVANADTVGSISGTITDQTGAVIPDTTVTALNLDTTVLQTTKTNANGFYNFTALPVGRYEIEILREGFEPYKRTGLVIDVNSQLRADVSLSMGGQKEEVVVSDNAVHVETENTQVGEVVSGDVMTGVALNGRSFTDLMSLQPGIVPMSTQTPDSVVMAGASVAIAPSGGLNPGNQSISGQREDANGFLVNGGDVKELMNGGTLIVPDLDSISEFRILTNNFDAEYGNYSGGIVNVVTKSGTNQLHGSGFEFLRNTALDAKNFFDPSVETYRQNQFGGTLGGPIVKNKLFFFADYQGTRTTEGISTGEIPVPTLAARSGNLLGLAPLFETGCSGGPCTVSPCDPRFVSACLATQLSTGLSSATGAPVTVSPGEPYYTAGCTSYANCVFPNAAFPMSAWSAPAQHLLQYIPGPNIGDSIFSTGSASETVRDDKGSIRADTGTTHWGLLSAYYFYDHYYVNNPYPTGQGGASVPGFNGLNLGTAQLLNLGDLKTFGSTSVNEFHLSYMRSYNNVGQPAGGVGPSLASQGFVTGVGTQGIVPLDPAIEGVENLIFNSFVVGTPTTNLAQVNDTYTMSDDFSRVIGKHTIKAGFELILDQINVHPDPEFNGGFTFTGSQTGSDFVDFLVGAPNLYNQADSQAYYPRHKYIGGFAQDSWQIKSNLTLNYGLRWDLMQYWSEKYNQIPTFIPGEQSQVYPTAPVSLVYPTDPGVPSTLVPQKNRFSPRFGLAYSPNKADGWLGKILGGPGKTSIRAGYGIFYSVIEGNTVAFDEPQPPYGLSYTSPLAPLFAAPFTAATGEPGVNPFPLTFPPLNASVSHPNPSVNFSQFPSIAGMTAPPPTNVYPYTENYFLSIERNLDANTVLDLSYVGSEAHHLLVVYSANPGNPALCLALPGCGPGGENSAYVNSSGQTINCTRQGLGCAFGNDDYDGSVGNSNYNSFQATVQRRTKNLNLMIAYTYSKSIDNASSLADTGDPYNLQLMRALSAFDLKHNLVATYEYTLPVERLSKHSNRWTQGWAISGITHASTGFPVTLSSDNDNSLQGSNPNGVNNRYLDLPDVVPGPLDVGNYRQNGQAYYFNISLFKPNASGTPGDASRRYFYGPGSFNTDLALLKSVPVSESKTLQLRLETFNVFNHTQFFGPQAVNGNISSPLFGEVVKAAPPRLMQLAMKFTF
ncbi:MAG TPA: TonB-dependent receptor [Candidatus Acidoferrales bacterium]|nr:TonB-dependent receptor [Candidatus Acidoferrales bacterium]